MNMYVGTLKKVAVYIHTFKSFHVIIELIVSTGLIRAHLSIGKIKVEWRIASGLVSPLVFMVVCVYR